MRIAIIGAGWYGCHIATQLIREGCHVSVFQPGGIGFQEASGNNQFRMHLGLHYARSSDTRHQSRDGFFRFKERYPKFTRDVENNLYLVPKKESLIDFNTYLAIMLSSGINVDPVMLHQFPYIQSNLIEGSVKCNEKVILTKKALNFFNEKLHDFVINEKISNKNIKDINNKITINGEIFDYLIDCTWGALDDIEDGYFFEGTVLFYYRNRCKELPDFPALTLVDGPLWSLYPCEDPSIYTLSHVAYTPIARGASRSEVQERVRGITKKDLEHIRFAMVEHVTKYVPDFHDMFEFVGIQRAIKMKPTLANDSRSCSIICRGRRLKVISGKIDNIFHAMDGILGHIGIYEEH